MHRFASLQSSFPCLALTLACCVGVSLGLGGCTGDDGSEHADEHDDHHAEDDPTTEEGHEHSTDTGHGSDCEMEDRDDEYAVGLSKSGTVATVSFVSASPAPPGMGNNTWVVALTDAGGQPLADASITAVIPFMPDHDHGTPVEAVVSPTENAGEFSISPVNLFMAGLWEVTLELDVGAGTSDEVVFAFCVE